MRFERVASIDRAFSALTRKLASRSALPLPPFPLPLWSALPGTEYRGRDTHGAEESRED